MEWWHEVDAHVVVLRPQRSGLAVMSYARMLEPLTRHAAARRAGERVVHSACQIRRTDRAQVVRSAEIAPRGLEGRRRDESHLGPGRVADAARPCVGVLVRGLGERGRDLSTGAADRLEGVVAHTHVLRMRLVELRRMFDAPIAVETVVGGAGYALSDAPTRQ